MKMCPTPNGNWISSDSCLCSIDCVECARKIDLHNEDTIVSKWTLKELIN